MADKQKPTELEEQDLDQVQGGYELKNVTISSYQLGGSANDETAIKPRLTESELGVRMDRTVGIRARVSDGTKIRK